MGTISSVEELQAAFGIAGVAKVIAGNEGLPMVRITSAHASGDIYLHGAHVTSWTPSGSADVIFLSERSQWGEGRAIRGGIPICFPWFGDKADDAKAPKHGFVRTRTWKLEEIASNGDAVAITLSTESNEETRKQWPHEYRLMYRATFGRELKLELITTNTGTTPLRIEEALHTYHCIGQIENIRVRGLAATAYLDKVDGFRRKVQEGDVVFTSATDRIYLDTDHAVEIVDPDLHRSILIEKEASRNTVVWNPWSEGAHSMSDMADDEWQQMVCIEACNVRDAGVEIAPGAQHTMSATIRVA
ncbi:MAG TPA: D-hexose-6-phosphate mutarotase [Acidisarcina sp.]|nr:D-hexose-6-phosphate mutarotase [Acidisarcina sp.]